MPLVSLLCQVSAFGIVPCRVELLCRHAMAPGNVLDLPGPPGDDGHVGRLSSQVAARVVSMLFWELFERQDSEYRERILPPVVTARIAVEQAGTFGWARGDDRRGPGG